LRAKQGNDFASGRERPAGYRSIKKKADPKKAKKKRMSTKAAFEGSVSCSKERKSRGAPDSKFRAEGAKNHEKTASETVSEGEVWKRKGFHSAGMGAREVKPEGLREQHPRDRANSSGGGSGAYFTRGETKESTWGRRLAA